MATTLQDMEHTIGTAFGDSATKYGGDAWITPLQGFYQGNVAGPTGWLIISSNLLRIMRTLKFGSFYKSTLSGKTFRIAGFVYVDDTNLTQSTSPEARTATEVLQRMQHGLDTWEGLITSTGRALSNEKSRWWFVDCQFNQSGDWSYKKVAELLGGLTTIDTDGVRKPIQCLEPEEPHETLGMFLDATGSGATTEQDAPMG
jgi:hypothetical protein